MEHGPCSFETLQHLIRAAELTGVLPIVRSAGTDAALLSKPLDLGAAGIQVPQITTTAAATAAIQATKFAPLGARGVCRFVRAAQFSALGRTTYFKQANDALLILQLEGTNMAEYEKIATLSGIDILFIGPYDLSQALGIPGQIDDVRVLEKMREIIAIAKRNDKVVGVFADTPEQAKRWVDAGVQYLAYSVDLGLFYDKCLETVKTLRQL